MTSTITSEWLRHKILWTDHSELIETLGAWCDEYPTLADELRAMSTDVDVLLKALDHDLLLDGIQS